MIIKKPWGFEKILFKSDMWKVKLLHINKGQRLSKQYHKSKWETLYYPNGEIDEIAPFTIHRPSAKNSKKDVEIIEVSTLNGGDQDIVRMEDDYGR